MNHSRNVSLQAIQNKGKILQELEWRDNTLPVSTRFDDPYYSRHDGRAETGHVFINGNNLPVRWPNMQTCKLAELGFGTGLNFLETIRQWQSLKPADGRMHFISFEQFPLSADAVSKALSAWPELGTLKTRLLDIWKAEPETSLDVDFLPDVHLTIHFSDANLSLPTLRFKADAWYLDGFSPSRNRELWNENLMREVMNHTVAGGTFATYTAAGFVRRNLQSAGFEVDKVKGFGSKREMLRGFKQHDIHVADRP